MKNFKFNVKLRPPVLLRPEPSDVADRAAYWFSVRPGELYGLGTVYGLDRLYEKWQPYIDGGRPDADSFERMKANIEPWVTAKKAEREVRIEVILRERYTGYRLQMIQLTRGWGVPAPALWGAILVMGMPYVDELLREWRPRYAAWVDSGAERDATSAAVQELWSGVIEVGNRRDEKVCDRWNAEDQRIAERWAAEERPDDGGVVDRDDGRA